MSSTTCPSTPPPPPLSSSSTTLMLNVDDNSSLFSVDHHHLRLPFGASDASLMHLSSSGLHGDVAAGSSADDSYSCLMSRRQRGEKRPIPDEQKDDKYFERRKRNNEAAKKSRDARKMREDRVEDCADKSKRTLNNIKLICFRLHFGQPFWNKKTLSCAHNCWLCVMK